MKDFRKIKTGESELNSLQDNLVSYFANFNGVRIIDGLLIEDITLKVGANTVAHKLDRQIVGYMIVSRDKNVQIWNGAKDNKNIVLQADVESKISLWVF